MEGVDAGKATTENPMKILLRFRLKIIWNKTHFRWVHLSKHFLGYSTSTQHNNTLPSSTRFASCITCMHIGLPAPVKGFHNTFAVIKFRLNWWLGLSGWPTCIFRNEIRNRECTGLYDSGWFIRPKSNTPTHMYAGCWCYYAHIRRPMQSDTWTDANKTGWRYWTRVDGSDSGWLRAHLSNMGAHFSFFRLLLLLLLCSCVVGSRNALCAATWCRLISVQTLDLLSARHSLWSYSTGGLLSSFMQNQNENRIIKL